MFQITDNSTSGRNETSEFEIDKKRAFNFLGTIRQRRDLYEECWEGCSLSEVKDHLRWSEESVRSSQKTKITTGKCLKYRI